MRGRACTCGLFNLKIFRNFDIINYKVKRERKENKMTRNEYDITLCWDEETNEFDWDTYQYLCDITEYWECEE